MRIYSIFMALAIALLLSIPANASVVTIERDYLISAVSDNYGLLGGIMEPGDSIHVSAFYDPDFATEIPNPGGATWKVYELPDGKAGVTFTVNGYQWIMHGEIPIAVVPSPSIGGWTISFAGHTMEQQQVPGVDTQVTTPFSLPGYMTMLFLPYLVEGVPTDGSLPLSSDDFIFWPEFTSSIGAFFQVDETGIVYSFHLYAPKDTTVPIPGAIWLLGSGLFAITGIRSIRKK